MNIKALFFFREYEEEPFYYHSPKLKKKSVDILLSYNAFHSLGVFRKEALPEVSKSCQIAKIHIFKNAVLFFPKLIKDEKFV